MTLQHDEIDLLRIKSDLLCDNALGNRALKSKPSTIYV